MVDKSASGASGEPFVVEVERGKIREFARATCSRHPAYLEEERPVAPPTFLTTIAFWERDDSNPWDRVRMDQQRGLHAEQEFVFHGPPPRAGTRLNCVSRIDEIYEKEGKRGGTLTFATMVTELRDESGQLVAESRLTGVETSKPPKES